MTMFHKFFILLFLKIFLCIVPVYFLTVGSDTAPSRQNSVTLPEEDSDNMMKGFAAFENGFTLETPSTTCTFDSFFPVSGTVNMNCGTLYLQKDLFFNGGTTINSLGNMYGNGFKVEFSDNITTLTAFANLSPYAASWQQLDSKSLTLDVNAVDWSYDGQYVAIGDDANLLTVYSFDGSTLTYVDNIDALYDVYAVRAHPSGYYFAIALADDTVKVYKLSGGLLSLVDSVAVQLNEFTKSVDWSSNGNYLAATYDEDLVVYSFASENLTYKDNLDWGSGRPKERACCWDRTNSYVVLGTDDGKVRIFYYNGATTVSVKDYVDIGSDHVTAVDWSKTGSWIAAGTNGSSNQLRVYEYNSGTDTLTQKNAISVGGAVLSAHWNSDTTKLLVGKANDTGGTEFRAYDFNSGDYSLTLELEVEKTTNINSVRWSNDDDYIAYGDDADNLVVYSYTPPFAGATVDSVVLNNVSFVFNNPLSWKMSTTVQLACSIDGRGNRITFEDDGEIRIASGAQLTLKNVELGGLSGTKISCEDGSASLVLKNCTLYLSGDFGFAEGSILFEGDTIISGTNQFSYSSSEVSTIASQSNLIIDNGATFYYSPAVANRDLLYMTDATSKLYLSECTLKSTSTGLRLTRGTLLIDNGVTFSCEGTDASESICFGNGVAANDLDIVCLGGAQLDVHGGLHYDNVA